MEVEILTTQEVCDKYRVSRATIERMRLAGKITFGMAGNSYRYAKQECDQVFLGTGAKKGALIDEMGSQP